MSPRNNKMSDMPKRAAGPRPPHGHGGPGARMMPGEKARDFKGTMRKLIAFMGKSKFKIALVILFAIGSAAFGIVGPKVLSEATTVLFNGIVAKVAGQGSVDFDLIGKILIATLLIYVFSTICSWAQGWIMSYVSQDACYRLRRQIIEKVSKVPMGTLDKMSTGDILSRITNDVDTLGQSLNQGVTQLITSATTVIGVLIMMLTINWIMTLVVVVMIPISFILMMLIVKISQKYFFAQQHLLGEVNGIVEETFSGHAVVKAFGREEEMNSKFAETNAKLCESAWKSQFLSGLMPPIMTFVGNLGYIAVAVTGSFFAVAGIITVGDIQAFIQYVKNFTQPLTQMAQVSNVLQQMAAAAERIFDFLETPEVSDPAPTATTEGVKTNIEFDKVDFGYDTDQLVLKDFSTEAKMGQTVAIVGPTGAGKTTCIKLLMRFYDVTDGSIRLGGHDIRDYSRADLRSLFAMVLQDTWLFNGTIRENIRYGRPDASDEEVEQAAKDACIHHFIMTLPGNYDFMISEDADNISTGQRQLLTIARAILANRRIMILDEATSSVDTRTEMRIQEAMDKLMHGHTSFVIAHRLSTIRNADLILVMKDGNVIEQGTHDELLSYDGFYSQLYNAQFESVGQ